MANTTISNLITSNISQSSSSDRITDSEVRSVLNAINSFIQDDVAYGTAIPFDKIISKMAPKTVTGAITFTKNTVGALAGCGTILRLTANGTNAPDFSAFKKSNASQDYVNTSGVVNVIVFFYDGVDYWYTIYQQAAVAVTPDAPTAGVVDDTADTFNWTNNPLFTALSDYEYTLNGGSSYTDVTAKPISIGNVAKAIGQVGVRVKAVGINPASTTLYNATAFTTAVVDTTAPTVSSKNTTSATNIRLVFSEVVTATLVGWSFKQNGSALVPTAISGSGTNTLNFTVPTMATGDVLLVSYDSGTGDTIDAASNELVSFTDSAVTNNIAAATIATTSWFTYHSPDLDTTHAVVGSDDLVSQIKDQASIHRLPTMAEPNNFFCEMVTDANKPYYIASGINGHPAIEVNSTRYLPSKGSWTPTLAKPHTKIVVFKVKTIGSNVYIVDGGSARAGLGIDASGKFFAYAGVILTTSVSAVVDTTYIAWIDFVAGASNVWINGTLVASGDTGCTSTNSVTNGNSFGRSASGANAWIGDIFTYAGIMSSADRTSITNELKTKYGVA